MNKSIEALPVATQNRLRSTQILTSLPQVVSELLQNALDAGARHVDIGVDRDDWSCWVRDDGHGISKDNMFLLGQGSEQGRYGASSCPHVRSTQTDTPKQRRRRTTQTL